METINNWWTNFSQKHKLVAQFVKFYAFSLFVTVLQYLLLTFLPGLFYNLTDWCSIPCQLIHLNLGPVDTYVFNYPVTGDATGGMGYFAAFAITLFLAQCVNFPMQRNITFKSKGNVSDRVVRGGVHTHHHRVQLFDGHLCAAVQAILPACAVQRSYHRHQRRCADGDLFPNL